MTTWAGGLLAFSAVFGMSLAVLASYRPKAVHYLLFAGVALLILFLILAKSGRKKLAKSLDGSRFNSVEEITRQGRLFRLRFREYNLLWATIACGCAAVLLRMYGPDGGPALILMAACLACATWAVAGAILGGRDQTLGVCWSAEFPTTPEHLSDCLPYAGAVMVLRNRREHARIMDRRGGGSRQLLLTAAYELSWAGRNVPPLRFWKREWENPRKESWARAGVMAAIFAGCVVLSCLVVPWVRGQALLPPIHDVVGWSGGGQSESPSKAPGNASQNGKSGQSGNGASSAPTAGSQGANGQQAGEKGSGNSGQNGDGGQSGNSAGGSPNAGSQGASGQQSAGNNAASQGQNGANGQSGNSASNSPNSGSQGANGQQSAGDGKGNQGQNGAGGQSGKGANGQQAAGGRGNPGQAGTGGSSNAGSPGGNAGNPSSAAGNRAGNTGSQGNSAKAGSSTGAGANGSGKSNGTSNDGTATSGKQSGTTGSGAMPKSDESHEASTGIGHGGPAPTVKGQAAPLPPYPKNPGAAINLELPAAGAPKPGDSPESDPSQPTDPTRQSKLAPPRYQPRTPSKSPNGTNAPTEPTQHLPNWVYWLLRK